MAGDISSKGSFSGAANATWDMDAINKAWAKRAAESAQAHDLRTSDQIAADKKRLQGDYVDTNDETKINPATGKNYTKYEMVEQGIRGEESKKFLKIAKDFFIDEIALRADGGKGLTTADAVKMIEKTPLSYHAMQAAQSYARGNSHSDGNEIVADIPRDYKRTPEDDALLKDKKRKFTAPQGVRANTMEDLRDSIDKTFREQVAAEGDPKLSAADQKQITDELKRSGVDPQVFRNVYGVTSQYKVPSDMVANLLTPPVGPDNASKPVAPEASVSALPPEPPKPMAPAAPKGP